MYVYCIYLLYIHINIECRFLNDLLYFWISIRFFLLNNNRQCKNKLEFIYTQNIRKVLGRKVYVFLCSGVSNAQPKLYLKLQFLPGFLQIFEFNLFLRNNSTKKKRGNYIAGGFEKSLHQKKLHKWHRCISHI